MLMVNTIFPPLAESPALLNIDIWKYTLANVSTTMKTIRSETLFLILGSPNLNSYWSPLHRFFLFAYKGKE